MAYAAIKEHTITHEQIVFILKEGGLDSEISVRTAIKHIWRMGWAYNCLLCYQFDSIGFHLCKQRHIENILSAASKQV